MRQKKIVSSVVLSFIIAGQVGWGAIALADDQPTPTPQVSMSPSPSPSVAPTPSPTASASPQPSASPAPSASPSPSPSTSPEPKKGHTLGTGPGQCTGVIPEWVYEVSSHKWVAADHDSFTCDLATGYWLSPKYYLDKRSGWYQIIPPPVVASRPDAANLVTTPEIVHTALGDLAVGSQDYQVAQALGLLSSSGGIVTPSGGTASDGQAAVSGSGQSWVDLTNLVNVINTLQSTAVSGNVNAASNTSVGDIGSGTASVISNLINLLASAWSWSNGNLNFFMRNIGSQTKDLLLDPTEATTGGGGQIGQASVGGVGLTVNAKDSGSIVNNVDVNAQSGNATASRNTTAGGVATGDALAQVNILNLINSFITSGSSFFGILNITGDLNGDILFPTNFLDGVVPSGAQATAVNQGSATLNTTVANTVNNNIQTTAASGTVSADSNTTTGSLASGAATTNQSLFNLSNSSIFGDNAVLVIVNVLGHWVGKFMTLPGGSSESGLLTGNAQVTSTEAAAVNVNQQATGSIANNVNVNAQSGDATAIKNTHVGDVTTGDAQAASNVANIFNSGLNLKHWFGVLVVNVFGNWLGDLNHDSAAGGFESSPQSRSTASTPMPRVGLLALVSVPAEGFVSGGSFGSGSAVNRTMTSADEPSSASPQVLTAAAHQEASPKLAAVAGGNGVSLLFGVSAGIMLVAGALASIDRRLRRRS